MALVTKPPFIILILNLVDVHIECGHLTVMKTTEVIAVIEIETHEKHRTHLNSSGGKTAWRI